MNVQQSDALTIVLRQFLETKDIGQILEDIEVIMERNE